SSLFVSASVHAQEISTQYDHATDSIYLVVINPERCRKTEKLLYIITNNYSDCKLAFGINDHTLRIRENDKWEKVPLMFHGVSYDLGAIVSPNSYREIEINLGNYILKPGHYRFGVPITIHPLKIDYPKYWEYWPNSKQRKFREEHEKQTVVYTEFYME
ncbi:MAG: hypothetical protein K2K55_03505, partial [Duncaniella sp.]|nr:hypothetical protein [Duncaniella sp.]